METTNTNETQLAKPTKAWGPRETKSDEKHVCAVQLKVVTCAADRRQTLFCMRKSRGQHGGGRSAWTPDLPKVKMMRYTSPPDPAHPHTHTQAHT